MRVLDRPAVSIKPGKDGCVIAQETQSKQGGMVEQTFDNPDKRTERGKGGRLAKGVVATFDLRCACDDYPRRTRWR